MELADDGEFSARIRWTPATGGPRTAATILVTPTALLGEATDWAAHLLRWIEWSYPLLSGVLTIIVSPVVRAPLVARMKVLPIYGGLVHYG